MWLNRSYLILVMSNLIRSHLFYGQIDTEFVGVGLSLTMYFLWNQQLKTNLRMEFFQHFVRADFEVGLIFVLRGLYFTRDFVIIHCTICFLICEYCWSRLVTGHGNLELIKNVLKAFASFQKLFLFSSKTGEMDRT